MRSFTERNPKRLGLIGTAVGVAIVLAVLVLNRGVFNSGYQVSARFANAAGIGKGTQVLVAGVPVGSVQSVRIDGNAVVATMSINHSVVLPAHTTAAIQVETLLGVLDVALQPVSGWSKPLTAGAMLTDTSVPTEFYQLQNTTEHLLTKSDTAALNNVISSLATITAGKRQQVGQIIDGLGALTRTVNERSGQVGQLIDSANQLSSVLAQRDTELTSVIDNLNTVAGGLADNSTDLAGLIDNVDSFAAQTNSLVGQDQPQLNSLLKNLHTDLGVVGQHQVDLAEAVDYLASAVKGFASVGYSGPDDTPNSWANVFTNPVTTASAYGVFGPCGEFDQALDQILGPDPLACDEQTGPTPTSSSSSTPATSSSGAAGPTPAVTPGTKGAAPGTTTTTTTPSLPSVPGLPKVGSGLPELLDPLAGGTK